MAPKNKDIDFQEPLKKAPKYIKQIVKDVLKLFG